jgi:hypothetical protein
VWETFNAGTDWVPLTDWEASLAIGAVTFAPSSSKIIYVGTGEANSSDSHTGAGLLKSVDGGATWTLLTGANGSGGAVSAATAAAFDVVIRNAIPQKTTESAGYFENI